MRYSISVITTQFLRGEGTLKIVGEVKSGILYNYETKICRSNIFGSLDSLS
jgi:hypothetical protein